MTPEESTRGVLTTADAEGLRLAGRSRRLEWLLSTDHKAVGIRYGVSAVAFLLFGGLLALVMRWQLAFPGTPLPWWLFGGLWSQTVAPGGILAPEFYTALLTMHATFMIYFAILPLLIGALGNYLIPLQIGATRLAFPRLSVLAFWTSMLAGLVMILSFFVEGGAASAGWTAYMPLAGPPGYTGVGAGLNLWIIGILLAGASFMMCAVNFITTIVNHRARGMTFLRMPMTVWSQLITAILTLCSVPVLAAAMIMLLCDRTVGTSFFIPAGLTMSGAPLSGWQGGGQPLLYQHLFWFFGHPVVYVLILPAMGVVSDLLATFARKHLFGHRAMIVSTSSIALLGLLVWGHHMFQSGMNPMLGTTFMISTMVIAVPSGVKVFNWLATIWGGRIHLTLPMLNALAFVLMFTVGGLSGVFMASTPIDAYIHDTYFIVAHFHYVIFGGTLFAVFGSIAYWFPKVTGRMLGHRLGLAHFWLTLVAFNCVFFPMHILGIGGMMRRIYDPTVYEHLVPLQPINVFISISAFVLGAAQILLVVNVVVSSRRGRIAGANPWHATTLEWATSSPPPPENFPREVIVTRGPYEYSVPDARADFLPQSDADAS